MNGNLQHIDNKIKLNYISANCLMDRIEQLMDQAESPYARAREILSKVKYDIDNSDKVLKHIRIALRETECESRLALQYNNVIQSFNNSGIDSKIYEKDISKFCVALSLGKYGRAERFLKKMKKNSFLEVGIDELAIFIVSAIVDNGLIEITINNNLDKTVIVEEVSAFSKTCNIMSRSQNAFSLAGKGQETIQFSVDNLITISVVNFHIKYKIGFETHSYSTSLTVGKGVIR